MSFSSLLIHDIVLRRVTWSGENETGDSLPVTTDSTLKGRMQQDSTSEDTDGRDTRVSTWTLFLPSDIDVEGVDEILHDGDTYAIVGNPKVLNNSTGVHHLELELRRVDG